MSSATILLASYASFASAQQKTSLCSLVSVETERSHAFYLAALRADGTLGGPPIALTVEPMSGMLACSPTASTAGTCLYSPPLNEQATSGLIQVDVGARTAQAYALYNPDGFDGTYEIGSLAASEVPGDAVALFSATASAPTQWVAVAELTPADGKPRVRANVTGEGFQQLATAMGSAYDPVSRTSYVLGSVGDAAVIVAVPLGPPSGNPPPLPMWLPNATLPPTFGILGFTWCGGSAQSVVAVGVVASPSVYGLIALSARSMSWRTLIAWTNETFYLSGLGQIACSPDGATVHTVLANSAGMHVVPAVDFSTGREVSRITMANASSFVGPLAYCDASFA